MTNKLFKLAAFASLTAFSLGANASYTYYLSTESGSGGFLDKGSISFVTKTTVTPPVSGGETETPTEPTTPTEPETPVEPEEPTKTVAESCSEVVTALRGFMASNGKTSTVSLSATQNAEAVGGCPVNVAVTFTEYQTYADLKGFIGSVIAYGNSLKVFSKDNASMTPVEMLGLKFINKGNPSYLVYWTGTQYAQETSFSSSFK